MLQPAPGTSTSVSQLAPFVDSFPPCPGVALTVLNHLNGSHLSLLLDSVRCFPSSGPVLLGSLYQASRYKVYKSIHLPTDIYGSRFSDSCPFTPAHVLVLSLPDCFPELRLISRVPAYPLVKTIRPNPSYRLLPRGSCFGPCSPAAHPAVVPLTVSLCIPVADHSPTHCPIPAAGR